MEKGISERLIGCVFEVSNALGAGFLEGVYEGALAVESACARLGFERQKTLTVDYKGEVVGRTSLISWSSSA